MAVRTIFPHGSARGRPDVATLHGLASVAGALADALAGRDVVSSDDILRLEHLVATGSPIDYEHTAEVFTQRYLLINFWKVAAALQQTLRRDLLFSGEEVRMLDLGAGSGASSLAFLASLSDHAPHVKSVEVTLVDRSARQLHIAREMLLAIAPKLGISVRVVQRAANLSSSFDMTRLVGETQVVLASHLLTEMSAQDVGAFASALLEACPANTLAVFVERADDPVRSTLLQHSRQAGIPCRSGSSIFDARRLALNDFQSSRRAGELPVGWVTANVPEWPWLPSLVRDYFRAWREQDIDFIDKVFSPGATYHEHPYEAPIEGVRGIQRYWREKVITQRDPRPEILSVAYGSGAAHVEWRAQTVIRGKGRELAGTMVLEVDPHREQVTSLREYFSTRDKDIDESS